MFDLGWPELMLIGIVALVVMGDDFPTMFRTLGRFTGKMRKMAREFSRAMEEAADDAGVKDVTNTLKSAASPKSMGLDALNKAAGNYEKWEAGTKRKAPEAASGGAAKTTGAPAKPAKPGTPGPETVTDRPAAATEATAKTTSKTTTAKTKTAKTTTAGTGGDSAPQKTPDPGT